MCIYNKYIYIYYAHISIYIHILHYATLHYTNLLLQNTYIYTINIYESLWHALFPKKIYRFRTLPEDHSSRL